MKTVVSFDLGEQYMQPELLSRLREIYPEGFSLRSFYAVLPEDDPRAGAIENTLQQYGKKKYKHVRGQLLDISSEYTSYRWHEYDDTDLAQAEYLLMTASYRLYDRDLRGQKDSDHPAFRDGQQKEDGPILLEHRFLRRDVSIAYTELGNKWVVLPDRSRREIEGAGLVGPAFLDTALTEKHGQYEGVVDWKHARECWWELSSSITLPPMSPTCAQTEFKEPAYRRADLERLPTFDLALTQERFGPLKVRSDSSLIASQRFHQFCKERKWPLEWVPVRIEP